MSARQFVYAYSRGKAHGNGSALLADVKAWASERGLVAHVSSAVSGPGYVIGLDGTMPEPEHVSLGSAYWYPEGAVLVLPERAS